MGTHNQNLLPGTDNTYDLGSAALQWKRLYVKQAATDLIPETDNSIELGSATKRWKKLYLRADSGTAIEQYKDGVSPAKVWELDHQGITRSGFEGMTTLTPAAAGNPDYVTVQLPRFIGCDFVVTLTGNRAIATADSTDYEIYADWFGPIYACSVNESAFLAYVTFHVYDPDTNRPHVCEGGAGPWNNLRRMCLDCGFTLDDIPTGLKTVNWIVRWPL